MEPSELVNTALRAAAMYVLMLIVIRVLGKRTVGNHTPFDLIVALMLGEVVDEIIYGDVSFMQGTVVIVVIAAAHAGNSWLAWWDHGFDRLLEGAPTVVVKNGEFRHEEMKKERMNAKEVMMHLRMQGIDDLREVKLAVVEEDGDISVIRHRWADPARKADVDQDAAKERDQATGGEKEPPPDKRTDSPEMLGQVA